jgi:Transposase zinc-binding domain/Putative transposase
MGSGGGGYLPPLWRSVSTGTRRSSRGRRATHRAAVGGHADQCDERGATRIAYNSCRNRHCPKCQGLARAQWLAERQAELLSVPYFHVVSILPARSARSPSRTRPLSTRSCSTRRPTLATIAADPKHLAPSSESPWSSTPGARPCQHHPHVHCVVPSTAHAWIACRRGFFLPVRVLSQLFRRLFLRDLQKAFDTGHLRFFGKLSDLSDPEVFARRLDALRA